MHSKLIFGGPGEGPQLQSLPVFKDLIHGKKPYSSHVFAPWTLTYSTIRGAIKWLNDGRVGRDVCGLSLLGVHLYLKS